MSITVAIEIDQLRMGQHRIQTPMLRVGHALFRLSDIHQLIWLESWNVCLVVQESGPVSEVLGELGKELWAFAVSSEHFLPGVNGKRLVRPGHPLLRRAG